MIHLKLFENEAAFETAKDSIEKPWVAYTEEEKNVHYMNGNTEDVPAVPNNEIWYTTSDGNILELTDFVEWWGDDEYNPDLASKIRYTLVSNTYENGIGKMTFAEPITSVGYDYHENEYGSQIVDNCYPLFSPIDDSTLKTIILPNSVTSIGESAFDCCSNLTSINISNSVTSIGNYVFIGCTGLASITIPNSVTSIGKYAFDNCTGLASINIPNSVTSIGEHVFEGCVNLTSITIPDSVISIGENAFGNCTSLTSITIPDSVTSIGERAFYGCTSLTEIHYNGSAEGFPWGAPSATLVTD